ncbi:MAG: F0F1 ATP synthase subunit epsilon [Lachnospiraceae bacterium]|nr:F0F1 ATP synthase subunit epsilon [Lachnospiraceae bacterium]
MNTFHLEILSPERPFYKGDCVSVVLPISDGMIGVMANHPAMTAVLGDGTVNFTLPSGEKKTCIISKGMFDISKNDARLLCESAIDPDEWDSEMERRREYEERIEEEERKARVDFMKTQIAIAKAVNTLKPNNRNQSAAKRVDI